MLLTVLTVTADGVGDWAAQTNQRQPKNKMMFGERGYAELDALCKT